MREDLIFAFDHCREAKQCVARFQEEQQLLRRDDPRLAQLQVHLASIIEEIWQLKIAATTAGMVG